MLTQDIAFVNLDTIKLEWFQLELYLPVFYNVKELLVEIIAHLLVLTIQPYKVEQLFVNVMQITNSHMKITQWVVLATLHKDMLKLIFQLQLFQIMFAVLHIQLLIQLLEYVHVLNQWHWTHNPIYKFILLHLLNIVLYFVFLNAHLIPQIFPINKSIMDNLDVNAISISSVKSSKLMNLLQLLKWVVLASHHLSYTLIKLQIIQLNNLNKEQHQLQTQLLYKDFVVLLIPLL